MAPPTGDWTTDISQKQYGVREERDVLVEMRDGIRLAVNVFRPDAEGEFPALLAMGGYGKETQDLDYPPQPLHDSAMWDGTIEAGDPQELVPRGYVHVIADARGTGDSDGEFRGSKTPQEGRDGYDLVEWIARQRWCTGHVGMTGYSYFSWTSLKTAIENPPHLDAVFVSHIASDAYRDNAYPGGILNMFYYGLWDGRGGSSGYAARNPVSVMQSRLSEAEIDERVDRLLDESAIRHRPNLYHLLHYPYKNPQFFDIMLNPYDNEYWRERSIYPYFDDIQVPVHVVGKLPHSLHGYWDVYLGIEAPKRLLVKPPGLEERPWREDLPTLIRWFDHWLKGNDTGIMEEPPIELFVHGANEWRQYHEWPRPDVERISCYLRRRNRLSFGPEQYQREPDAFVQEPLHVGSRRASITYVSPPFPGALELIGRASLTFFASIDREDTTWIISLSAETPGGGTQRLGKGYLKASHRSLDPERSIPGKPHHPHTKEAHAPVIPVDINEYTVELGPLATVLPAGSRLELEFRSMESPRDPEMQIHYHPRATHGETVLHRIYRDPEHPSRLSLPAIDPDSDFLGIMSDDSFMTPRPGEE